VQCETNKLPDLGELAVVLAIQEAEKFGNHCLMNISIKE